MSRCCCVAIMSLAAAWFSWPRHRVVVLSPNARNHYNKPPFLGTSFRCFCVVMLTSLNQRSHANSLRFCFVLSTDAGTDTEQERFLGR